MSSSPSSSSSTASSSSRRRVTFMDTDTIISIPHTPSETVSEIEDPQIAPPLHSPHSTTSTLSTSGPYTPPSNSEGDILIQGRGVDSFTPTLSDSVDPLEALDTYKPHGLLLHKCLTTSNPAHWDMLIDPQTPPRLQALVQFGHHFMTPDAFPDSVSKIRINCDILPWPITIDIKQDADCSPRIEDIFESIYVSLWKLASSADFKDQTTERQHRILQAYRRRSSQPSVAGERAGLRRIDFLDGQTMFLGLSPGSRVDEWHLHVGNDC